MLFSSQVLLSIALLHLSKSHPQGVTTYYNEKGELIQNAIDENQNQNQNQNSNPIQYDNQSTAVTGGGQISSLPYDYVDSNNHAVRSQVFFPSGVPALPTSEASYAKPGTDFAGYSGELTPTMRHSVFFTVGEYDLNDRIETVTPSETNLGLTGNLATTTPDEILQAYRRGGLFVDYSQSGWESRIKPGVPVILYQSGKWTGNYFIYTPTTTTFIIFLQGQNVEKYKAVLDIGGVSGDLTKTAVKFSAGTFGFSTATMFVTALDNVRSFQVS